MGISARLAMRMGYHRDPRHFKNLSPFEGEMRRRIFFVVEAFDLLLSFQAGLPAIIHNEEECDTELPRNLFDEDFDETCEVLPSSRPLTDPTPMLSFCYKGRFAKVMKHIIRHALSLKRPSYENTMKLDQKLHELHEDVPPSLRTKPLASSFLEQAPKILFKLNIDLVYLESLCVLHRSYLSHDRSNPTYAYSRKTCMNAATKILNYQAELYVSTQPGGHFFYNRWMLSSLTLHAFLIAAMITCLDLYESNEKANAMSQEDLQAQAKKYDALRLSHEIWTSRREFSREARRASNVLAAMLSKVQRPNMAPTLIRAPQESSGVSQASMNGGSQLDTPGNPSESLSWSTATNGAPDPAFPMDDNATSLDLNSMDPLNTMFNEIENIDWVNLEEIQK